MFGIDKKKRCGLCHKEVDKFIPLDLYYLNEANCYGYQMGKPETMNIEEYSCPFCYGADRDRLCSLFFERLAVLKNGKIFKNVKLLDIAPSGPIQKFLDRELGEIIYDTADLFMEDVDYQVDIQDMDVIESERYDLFICSHVLEHVQDDNKSMKELYRILKPNGIGIVLVPLDLEQSIIDEAWGLTEEENWRRFGQGDHVRKYSKDGFIKRLEEVGFRVNQLGQDYFGKGEYRKNAINKEAVLYVVDKNDVLDKKKDDDICNRFIEEHEFYSNDIRQFVEKYQCNKEQYNLYFDKVVFTKTKIYIWGWFYFENINSKYTKLKLLIYNREKSYIYGTKTRMREDIEQTFNNKKDGNYIFSGIEVDIQEQLDSQTEYNLYLLAENKGHFAMIHISESDNIEESVES